MEWAIFLIFISFSVINGQDYEVADVQCIYGDGSGKGERLMARLRKPEGFRGSPIFADDRKSDPVTDPVCQIREEPNDVSGRIYRLLVTDFDRCGVVKRNDYVTVRVWFPVLTTVVTAADQEVILMCRPPKPTVVSNRASSFASSVPNEARISGVVEESSSAKLEYEVALFREALSRRQLHVEEEEGRALTSVNSNALPVDSPVPIGTRLQLKASINPSAAWRWVKLMEVTVSADPHNPHHEGHVKLVDKGCRNPEFQAILPHQPGRSLDRPYEAILEFEAFMLLTNSNPNFGATKRAKFTRQTPTLPQTPGQLWIHTTVLACIEQEDCLPELCPDLIEPAGYGRKKRSTGIQFNPTNITRRGRPRTTTTTTTNTPLSPDHRHTQFGNNVGMQVLAPEYYASPTTLNTDACPMFFISTIALSIALVICGIIATSCAIRASKLSALQEKSLYDDELRRDVLHATLQRHLQQNRLSKS